MTAEMMRETTQNLTINPHLDSDQLVQEITDKGLVTHPEAIRHYVSNLIDQKRKVALGIQHVLDHQSESDFSKEIFKRIQRNFRPDIDPQMAQFPLRIDQSNPLALIMLMNESDFDLIDPRENAGGYSQQFQKIDIPGEEFATVPLIAVTSVDYVDHELTHVNNKVIINALENFDKPLKSKTVWGNVSLTTSQRLLMSDFLDQNENPSESNNELVELAISYALGRAKDEILADWQRSMSAQFINMTQEGALYDYFASELWIDPNSEIHKHLWTEYEGRLKQSIERLSTLHHKYSMAGLTSRLKLFPFIFSQIPIESFNDQIHIYEKELLAYEAFVKKSKEVAMLLRRSGIIRLTVEEEKLVDQVDDVRYECNDLINDNPGETFYVAIEQMNEKLVSLQEEIEACEGYRLINQYKVLKDLSNSIELLFDEAYQPLVDLKRVIASRMGKEPRVTQDEIKGMIEQFELLRAPLKS